MTDRERTGREPVLEVRGLTKKFGGFAAVEDLNLEVRRGDVYGSSVLTVERQEHHYPDGSRPHKAD